MTKAFLTLLLSVSLILPSSSLSAWPVERVLKSIIPITVQLNPDKTMGCSAFSIKPEEGLFVTAGHCTAGALTAGRVTFGVVEVDKEADLAVIQADGLNIPALQVAHPPKRGASYHAVGYPAGIPNPVLVPSVFQGEFPILGEESAVFVGNTLPGMSGGPIVDDNGIVVSVVLAGGNPATVVQNLGFGARFKALFRLVKKHL